MGVVSASSPTALEQALVTSKTRHRRLCPRQVLGARMGFVAGGALDLTLPRADKRLLVFVETDGCFVDGVEAATGCGIGRRTLRLEDFGKVAATFFDIQTMRAVRVVPRPDVRTRAADYAAPEDGRYYAQLRGYQEMPDHELLEIREVEVMLDLDWLRGRAGIRSLCTRCGEEVINGRELRVSGAAVCRSCLDGAYYRDIVGSGLA